MLLCLARDAFIRIFEDIGYIVNKLTRQDRIYDINGKVFLQQITRKPQNIDEIIKALVNY